MKRIIYTAFLFIFLPFLINSTEINNKRVFLEANKFYSEKKYNQAINRYLLILTNNNYNNFELNYNLGCCYYKLNKLGPSRFHFEKALSFKPFDKDLFHNLNILYSNILTNQFEGEQVIMNKRIIYFFPSYINILLIILFLTVTLVFLFLFFKSRLYNKIYLIILVISLFFSLTFTAIYFIQYFDYHKNIFIIKTKTADIYLTPDEKNSILSPLTEGTKGIIIDEFNDYIRIKQNDNISGWIKKDHIIYEKNKTKVLTN